jgi:hypothetical protein
MEDVYVLEWINEHWDQGANLRQLFLKMSSKTQSFNLLGINMVVYNSLNFYF